MSGQCERRRRAAGFSLVELLVVIMIIVIVIALVIPALGGARNVARLATTQTTIKEFTGAVDAFRQDHGGRAPGVFSPTEMGNEQNASNYGFSAMENAILDLAGGVVYDDSGAAELKNFGPSDSAHDENEEIGRFVRTDLIGADYEGNPGYYQPMGKFFKAMAVDGGQQFSNQTGDANIPDLLDAWGNPLLLWIQDDTAPPVTEISHFAAVHSTHDHDTPARFYWASNAAFLKATRLGDGGKDQTALSLLGVNDETRRQINMAGALGNPGYPATELEDGTDPQDVLPSTGRGGVVVQSAGNDGVYLSSRDDMARSVGAADDGLHYGYTFFNTSGDRIQQDGVNSTRDLLEGFDDVVVSAGN